MNMHDFLSMLTFTVSECLIKNVFFIEISHTGFDSSSQPFLLDEPYFN